MTLRGVAFFIMAVASGLLCVRVALVPVGILLGKLPEADADMIAETAFRRSLPILLPGAFLWTGALVVRAHRGYGWVPLVLLIAAPCASIITMLLVLR